MLLRYYDPQEGQILVDGVDLKELDVAWWRQNIGIVSQEPNLFSGTVADNIRLGRPDATPQEIKDACAADPRDDEHVVDAATKLQAQQSPTEGDIILCSVCYHTVKVVL